MAKLSKVRYIENASKILQRHIEVPDLRAGMDLLRPGMSGMSKLGPFSLEIDSSGHK